MAYHIDTNVAFDILANPTNKIELEDTDVIKNQILNLFATPAGSRAGIFSTPGWGTRINDVDYLPVSSETAHTLRTIIFHDIERFIPNVQIDIPNTRIYPLTSGTNPGFGVEIAFIYNNQRETASFTLTRKANLQPN